MPTNMPMKNINRVVIHCTATTPTQKAGYPEVFQWHVKENGWDNVGYHLGINRDGEIWMGRKIDFENQSVQMGAHAYPHNRNSIGIVLEGGCSRIYKDDAGKTDYDSEDNFTDIQKINLAALVKSLIERLQKQGAKDIDVCGHTELKPEKKCPGFDVKKWWASVE